MDRSRLTNLDRSRAI